MNLGTPDSPEAGSVRKYLRQFLSDTRVVEFPKPLWAVILNCIILTIRPKKSAEAYREIWQDDGSPLMINTIKQVQELEKDLHQKGISNVIVRAAMRYGEPSITKVFDEATERGIRRILVLPLYPQYSGSTIGSVFDAIGDVTRRRRYVPSIRFLNGYAVHKAYIRALQVSVREHWVSNGRAEKLVMSFHGLPQAMSDKGDPYYSECEQTAAALAELLNLQADEWTMCFQSRFGPTAWLQPYTEDVLKQLVSEGITNVDVICPGFSSDCLETLEEINIQYRNLFLNSGGNSFQYIPCLNDHPMHIDMLAQFVLESAADWIDAY